MPRRAGLSDRRLRALERGADATPQDMAELVRLARLGRQLEHAPDVVILGQAAGQRGDAPVRHTWTVDTGFDDLPAVAALLGHRVRVVPQERVMHGYRRGEGWPKGDRDPALEPGVLPPRHWQSARRPGRDEA